MDQTPSQVVRFTPDELEAIFRGEAGPVPPDFATRLHPDDRKVFMGMFPQIDPNTDKPPAVPGWERPVAALSTMTPMLGAAPGAIGIAMKGLPYLKDAGKIAALTAVVTGAQKAGVPASAIDALMIYLGLKAGKGLIGKGEGPPVAPGAPRPSPGFNPRAGMTPPELIRDAPSGWRIDPAEIKEQVGRGVQVESSGARPFGQTPPLQVQSNGQSTGLSRVPARLAGEDAIREAVTGSSRAGFEDTFHSTQEGFNPTLPNPEADTIQALLSRLLGGAGGHTRPFGQVPPGPRKRPSK